MRRKRTFPRPVPEAADEQSFSRTMISHWGYTNAVACQARFCAPVHETMMRITSFSEIVFMTNQGVVVVVVVVVVGGGGGIGDPCEIAGWTMV
jgi:hypothetical protein